MSLLKRIFGRCPLPAPGPVAPRAGDELPPLGIVAGRGVYPLELCRAARRAGVPRIAVVALCDETDPAIAQLADHVDWSHVGQLRRTMDCLHSQGMADVMFVGQVRPGRLFGDIRPDFTALRLLWGLKERHAHSIFGAIADLFERHGFRVLPAWRYLEHWLAGEGQLGRHAPRRSQRRDIAFGLRMALGISRLDIGQTVVVRNGTVLAVEAFEGTDKAIRRGGELGRGQVTVVKVAKPGHDVRFDLPCIGLNTVESLTAARAGCLAVETGRTLFLERDAVMQALDAAGIAVVGVRADAAAAQA